MPNFDILSYRYATPEINEIFSDKGKIIKERELWIAVMKAQQKLGLNIPSEDIDKFEKAKDNVDLEKIKEIELKTKHDIKAKIEAFIIVANAGQHLHKGMTSRDLTENVEQMQLRDAARLIFGKYISVLRHMLDNAAKYKDCVITARTHNQPAQPTLFGKRFAMWAEELMNHLIIFEKFIENLSIKGIKGPTGTQFDMLTLLGSQEKVDELERIVAEKLGFKNVLNSPGQVYPRSFDYALANHLAQLSSAASNFATTIRLMAGYGLVNESFEEGQAGSSIMPYKMNTIRCERINGFANLIKMFSDGISRVAGDQWQEGDVSCSVVRRVVDPGMFYASDGLCETVLTILRNMKAYEGEIIREVEKYLPFMSTTEVLDKLIKVGIGREDAHEIIKKITIEESQRMKREGSSENNVVKLLAAHPVIAGAGIKIEDIQAIIKDKEHFIGNARKQIDQFIQVAQPLLKKYAKESGYEPGPIL